jgi:hypothetical protein
MSRHATERLVQRGYCDEDLRLVIEHGTATCEGYYMRGRDIEAAREDVDKSHWERLSRLAATLVVVGEGGVVITVYRAGRRTEKRLLRKSELARSRPRKHRRRKASIERRTKATRHGSAPAKTREVH